MPLRRKKPFTARADGTFEVNLSDDYRELVASLADQLDEIVVLDLPQTRRLFPTAYPDDPEKDAGYQVFARDQLVNQRQSAADTVRATINNDRLTEEEIAQWMSVVNDARLVLGTHLDVSDDDEFDVDFDDPDLELHLIYEALGVLLHQMVTAMSQVLPEPSDPEEPVDPHERITPGEANEVDTDDDDG